MIAIYVIRRLCIGVLVLFILSAVVFSMLQLSPGTPLQSLLGTRTASPELVQALQARYHLDESFPAQYLHWLSGAARLDLGESISVQSGEPVQQILAERAAVTAELAIYGLLLVALVGLPLGMLAGIRRGKAADRVVSIGATIAISAPSFVVAILLLYVFGVNLGWFPVYGAGTGVTDRIVHLTLPAITLALVLSAVVIRQTRAAMLTVMAEDHVTFARLRGLHPAYILVRYALRNAALPIVTVFGLLLVSALTSAVLIEQVFSLPGLGSLLVASVTNEDVPVVQGTVLILGCAVVIINLLVDVVVLAIDPRTRMAKEGA